MKKSRTGALKPRWWDLQSLLLLLSGALLIAGLWYAFNKIEHDRLRAESDVRVEQMGLRLQAWIADRVAAASHLAHSDQAHMLAPSDFRAQVRTLTEAFSGFLAMNFVDVDGVIRITAPERGNEAAQDADLTQHPNPEVRAALKRAREHRQIFSSSLIHLLQGGAGFATYEPVLDAAGQILGFVNAVFRVQTLVDSCLGQPGLGRDYRYRLLSERGEIAYVHDPVVESGGVLLQPWAGQVSFPVEIVDTTWELQLAPTPALREQRHNRAVDVMSLLGLGLLVGLLWMRRQRQLGRVELEQAQQGYRLLVENTSDLIIKIDAAGRFLYASPNFCRVFGTTEREVLGQPLLPRVHRDFREAAAEALRQLNAPPYRCYVEQRALTVDGLRWFGWSGTAVLDEQGSVVEIIGVGRDIDAHKELQAQLQQAQKMETVGQLAGGVAHDFNNILQAILGNLDLARDQVESGSPLDEDLQQIGASAHRARQLTHKLLAFSRRQMLDARLMDPKALIEGIIDMLRRVLGEQVEVSWVADDDLGLIRADAQQLELVVLNLCVNARDAMPEGGHIDIELRRQIVDRDFCERLSPLQPGEHVVISVADDGQGMSPDVRDRIFEPFFTTKAVGKGTGLGLAMVYGIVQQHDGAVDVWSEPDAGSRFRLFLPRFEGEAQPLSVARQGSSRGGTETILFAEDDASVRALVTRVLERAGYTVRAVVDGERAVELFAADPDSIDLALLDIVMPRKGGHEAATEMRALRPELKVIFATGYDPSQIAAKLDGDETVLSKPFVPAKLLASLRQVLDMDK